MINKDNLIYDLDVGGQLHNSDHREIRFNIKCKASLSPNLVKVPDFRRADYSGLKEHLVRVYQKESGDIKDFNMQVFIIGARVTKQPISF